DDAPKGSEIAIETARRFADDDVEFGRRRIGAVVAGECEGAGTMNGPLPAILPPHWKTVDMADLGREQIAVAKWREALLRRNRLLEFRLKRRPLRQRGRFFRVILCRGRAFADAALRDEPVDHPVERQPIVKMGANEGAHAL